MDEQSIFLQALEKSNPEDRAAWLDKACGDDERFKQHILGLLERHQEAQSFLEKPPAEFDATIGHGAAGQDLAEALDAGVPPTFGRGQAVVVGSPGHSVLKILGHTIDVPHVVLREPTAEGDESIQRPNSPEIPKSDSDSRYQLQGEIARGGMGAIIRGRDTDLGRDLAIKVLLDAHKDKPEVIQRFVEEAQIGGQLQHPGIAPIYELGQFADKRPFFSMKLVKGKTLAKLLAERKRPSEDRGRLLGIFEQICQTMAYAHSRGVIHRDLKPANIMVGAFGEVQVMDWGLAKVLSVGGVADEKQAHTKHKDVSIIQTMRTVGSDLPGTFGTAGSHTQMGSVMGTPAYMPPEQALGEIDNLDERADVFGLGAILSEILTGKPPYVADNGTQIYRLASRGKLEGCFARLQDCGADAELIQLTRDCLEIEPQDRPRNAGVLAERLADYLESVAAKLRESELQRAAETARAEEALHTVREQETAARAQRRAGRLSYAIAALLFVGLVGAGFSANHFREQERKQAKLTKEKSQLANEKEAARLRESDRAEGERLAKLEAQAATAQARKQLTQIENGIEVITSIFTDLDIEEVHEGTEPLEAVLAKRLVNAAEQLEGESVGDPVAVARLQDRLGESLTSLGFAEEAVLLLARAQQTLQMTLGDDHLETLTISGHLARAYLIARQLDQARTLLEEMVPRMRGSLGENHFETLKNMGQLAEAYSRAGHVDQAVALQEETLTRTKATLGDDHKQTLQAMHTLAMIYSDAGELAEALPLQKETLLRMKVTLGDDHPDTLSAMHNLSGIYHATLQFEKALTLLERILPIVKAKHGSDHPHTLLTTRHLAACCLHTRNYEKALTLYEELLTREEAILGYDHPGTLETMQGLSSAYRDVGQFDKAASLGEEALSRSKAKHGSDHLETHNSAGMLASIYRDAGRFDRALPLFQENLQRAKETFGENNPLVFNYMGGLARTYAAAGQYEEAFPLFEETLRRLNAATSGTAHPRGLLILGYQAEFFQAAGRQEEASQKAREVATVAHQLFPPDSPALAEQLALASLILVKTKAFAEAEMLCRECLATREQAAPNAWNTFHTRSLLGAALLGQQKYPEAEPLLLAGYQGMTARVATIAALEQVRLNEVLQWLVELYSATEQPEEAKKWQAELERRMAENQPPQLQSANALPPDDKPSANDSAKVAGK